MWYISNNQSRIEDYYLCMDDSDSGGEDETKVINEEEHDGFSILSDSKHYTILCSSFVNF